MNLLVYVVNKIHMILTNDRNLDFDLPFGHHCDRASYMHVHILT